MGAAAGFAGFGQAVLVIGLGGSRIALAGESAGGNLVAALAIANASRRPEPFLERVYDANINLRATISTYPFADVAEIDSMLKNPRYPRWLRSQLFDAASAYLGGSEHRVEASLGGCLSHL